MLLVISLLALQSSSQLFILLPLPPLSSAAPPLPSSSPAVPSSQPTAPPFSAPSSVSLGSLSAPRGWGVSALDSALVVSSAPPGFPPLSAPSSLLSVPLSAFAYPPDDPFAPGFVDPEASGSAAPDPEAPVPPPLSDSACAEVCHMYQYLVDLFPQAEGSLQAPSPPRALFEEFFATPSSPHQPVFLTWFERVRSTLSETDSRIASLLASGHPESSLLPPRNTQYSVGGEASLGSAAPVNPSLLAMFKRPLRPSLHLGHMVREAALLESSSRALSESLSHAMWLLSGLLGFVRLQGFSPSDVPLFNTLVTSLSKYLAHQASISASQTAFVGLKRRQFYLSHLPAYFTDVHKRSVRTLCFLNPTSRACCLTPRLLPPSGLSRL